MNRKYRRYALTASLSAFIFLSAPSPLIHAQDAAQERYELLRGQNQLLSQVMSLLIEQNQILKHMAGAAMAKQNEARMTNVLLCDARTRYRDKLVNKLCQAIRAEYDAVQKALDEVKEQANKGDKS